MSQIELRSSPTFPEMLSQAGEFLNESEAVIQQSVQFVAANTMEAGRLNAEKFDALQKPCYMIAVAKAELEAARALLAHARTSSAEDCAELLQSCALAFCAEVVKSIVTSYLKEGSSAGVFRPRLAPLLAREDLTSWLDSVDGCCGQFAQSCMETGLLQFPAGLSQEQALVRDTFRRFADERVAPVAEEIHRKDTDIPEEILEAAAGLGCFGTSIPERFGGLQPDDKPDSLGMIIVTEELSRASLGAAGSLITRPEIAARALLAGGSPEQQQRWLPPLASGEKLCAISITEPDAGSDVAAVSLRASKVDGGWRLNGSKTWCTFAGRSELIVVLARTNDESGHRGLSLFVLEKPAYRGHEFSHQQQQGGKLSGRAIATLGYRGMHSFELFFEDYFVPSQNLIGEEEGEGKGFYYTMAGFAGGRLQTAARATGVMQAALEQAIRYASDRRIFQKPLSDFPLTRSKISHMLATVTAARQFSYAVASAMDLGGGQMEASLVKLFSCRAAEWVTREAMQLHGGMGYAEESAVSRYFADARVLSIFEGTEEVLAIRVIARELVEQHST